MPALPPGKKTSLRFIRAQGPPLPSSRPPSPAPHKVSLGACSGERRPLGGDRHCPAQPQDTPCPSRATGEAPSAQSPSSPDAQPEVAPHLVGMPAMLPQLPSMCAPHFEQSANHRPVRFPLCFLGGNLLVTLWGCRGDSKRGHCPHHLEAPATSGRAPWACSTLCHVHFLPGASGHTGLGFLSSSREHVPMWVFVKVASGLLFNHHASIERLLHARN